MKTLLTALLLCLCCLSEAQTQYAWVQRAGCPGPGRHRTFGAAAGSRVYIGTGHVNSVSNVVYQDWWEYDPSTNSWMQRADFAGGKRYHGVAFAIGNSIYAGTGRDTIGNNYNDLWRYDPVNNSWSAMAPYPGAGVRGAVAFTISGKGYIATGSGTDDLYEYTPSTNSWAVKATMPGPGRTSGVGFSIGNKGYVTTGDINGSPSADLWEYDPVTNQWAQKASMPGLPRMEACGFALNGYGFVGTGDNYSSGDNYGDFWAYRPATNTWVQVADFAGQARRYMGVIVLGNRAYAGMGTSGTNYSDFWEYGMLSDAPSGAAATPELKLAPNPCTAYSEISLSVPAEDASVRVHDISGREVQRIEHWSGDRLRLSCEGLRAGTYFVSVLQRDTPPAGQTLVIR